MVSLRFPFLFSQPPSAHLPSNASSRCFSATAVVAAAATIGGAAAIIATQTPAQALVKNALINSLFPNQTSPMWGSLSLTDNSAPAAVESKAGVSFPSVIEGSKRLMGVGVRKKSIFGLKNIDVYAYGVYADGDDAKKLLVEKYGKLSLDELKGKKELNEALMESDIGMTVRLQIVYSKLSIRSVRSAFEESVGSRLQKFRGPDLDTKKLLQSFTSQFKDEIKIPKGSVIEMSRDRGHELHTKIDGVEVGSIKSKLLCMSIFDLYIGEDSFDKQAKEDVRLNVASLLGK